jgi:hypothetical protein
LREQYVGALQALLVPGRIIVVKHFEQICSRDAGQRVDVASLKLQRLLEQLTRLDQGPEWFGRTRAYSRAPAGERLDRVRPSLRSRRPQEKAGSSDLAHRSHPRRRYRRA